MWRVLAEDRRLIKELKVKKAAIVLELRGKRKEKKAIDLELARLRRDIKSVKGSYRDL